MHLRIKELRNHLGLTQQEFADRLGLQRSTIASHEGGFRYPSNVIVTAICREFGVDEIWLRTGEGEMFRAVTREEEIAAFFGDLMSGEPDHEFKRTLIYALSRLDADAWVAFEKFLRAMIDAEKEKDQ